MNQEDKDQIVSQLRNVAESFEEEVELAKADDNLLAAAAFKGAKIAARTFANIFESLRAE